ncbi:MAG TPA: fasciclin domain-containing protein [Blastocatellia bacterium]|nr:fasciclin domain-containing protein [Blastocatellia bacterium]
MKRVLSLILLLFVVPVFTFGDEFRPIVIPPGSSLIESLRNDPAHFSKLIALAERSGLKGLTARGERFTLFAPTNEAFDKLPKGEYETLMKDQTKLRQFLRDHLMAGKVLMSKLFDPPAPIHEGEPATKEVKTIGGIIAVLRCNAHQDAVHHPLINNRARVLAPDFEGTNVVIHVVDAPIVDLQSVSK